MPSNTGTSRHPYARPPGVHNDPRRAAVTRTDSQNITGSVIKRSFNDSSWNKHSSNAQVVQTPYSAASHERTGESAGGGESEIPRDSSQPEQRLGDRRRPNERGNHANSAGVANSHHIAYSKVRGSLNDSSINKYSQNARVVLTSQPEHDGHRATGTTNSESDDESESETFGDDPTQRDGYDQHQDDVGHDGVANSHTVTKSTVVDAFNDSSMNKDSKNARVVQIPQSEPQEAARRFRRM